MPPKRRGIKRSSSEVGGLEESSEKRVKLGESDSQLTEVIPESKPVAHLPNITTHFIKKTKCDKKKLLKHLLTLMSHVHFSLNICAGCKWRDLDSEEGWVKCSKCEDDICPECNKKAEVINGIDQSKTRTLCQYCYEFVTAEEAISSDSE